MLKFLVKAFNGIGKEKVFAGEREIDQPQNLAEAVIAETTAETDGEKAVLEFYWAAKVIDVQRQLRAKTGEGAKAQLAAILTVAKQDPKVAELLKAANIKLPWEKVEAKPNGETTPPTPTEATPPAPPAPKEGETQVSPTVKRRRSK